MLPDWLDPSTLRDAALLALIAFAVTAVLIMRFVQKMLIRVVLIGLVGAFALALYTQRESLADCAETCDCTFFSFDVEVPGCRGRE